MHCLSPADNVRQLADQLQATDIVCSTDCDYSCMSAQQHVQNQHVVHRQTLQSDDVTSRNSSCFSNTQSLHNNGVFALAMHSRINVHSALIHLLSANAS